MTNYPFWNMNQIRDVEPKNAWKANVLTGKESAAQYMDEMRHTSRDNARTPMQWDRSANAGFTTGVPWLAVNPNYKTINASQEVPDPNSVYSYFRKLIAVRAKTPALIYRNYQDLDPGDPNTTEMRVI